MTVDVDVGGKTVRIRLDQVFRSPDGSILIGVESKYGQFARLTKNQTLAYPAINAGAANAGAGNNAKGLNGESIKYVFRDHWYP